MARHGNTRPDHHETPLGEPPYDGAGIAVQRPTASAPE
ncbi:hypothetical protein BJ992_005507 [Sphaerisporangium rubeum]|uniref:Uncharacterized protein n=1 Tax=Sphaerisporangium rubeum TaxID=321317 RepID=A0A7X0MAJ4_9ACTN|nr:hypothetical protein [Sphaerisporangium rubeum]